MAEHTPTIDLAAEEYLIAAILSDNKTWDMVGDRLSPDIFYSAAHRHIIGGAQRIADKGGLVDFVSISQYLRDAKLLDAVGGDARLLDLSESIAERFLSDPRKVEDLCDRLMACYQRRQLSAALKEATDTLKDPLQPIEDILGAIEKQVIDIRQMAAAANKESGLWPDVTLRQLDDITNQLAAGEIDRIATGCLDDFDEICSFQRGDLVGLIGAPGSGKTALACGLAYNYAKMGHSIFFWTLEQPEKELWARVQAAETGINHSLLGRKRHLLTSEQVELVAKNHWDNIDSPLSIYVCPDRVGFESRFTEFEIHLKRQNAPAPTIVFVDHLQHIAGNEPLPIGDWCNKLKDFAKQRNVVVFLLIQPPDLSGRNDKRPAKNDISGAKIAWPLFDLVIGQHREGYWDENYHDPYLINLRVLKNRHGIEGSCDIRADFTTCRFTQVSNYGH